MFITLKLTNRERYCKAVRYLMESRGKYNLINRGRVMNEGSWYVYFSKRVKK